MLYVEWLNEVDRLLEARCGLDHRDLVDYLWADLYEEGISAQDAVDQFCDEMEVE